MNIKKMISRWLLEDRAADSYRNDEKVRGDIHYVERIRKSSSTKEEVVYDE